MKAIKKKILKILKFTLAAALFIPGLLALIKDLPAFEAKAEGNVVFFEQASVETDNTNVAHVNLVVEGTAGNSVVVSYSTSDGTAMDKIDYVGTSNTITLKINNTGRVTYPVAIKCLNDSNTREKLRVYEGDKQYGRHFYLDIVSALNANIGTTKNCKCYLPYNNKVEAKTGTTTFSNGK